VNQDFITFFTMAWSGLSQVWYLVVPFALYSIFVDYWMDFVDEKWESKLSFITLEIVAPKEMEKSPQLMEQIYAGFSGVISTPTVTEHWVDGKDNPKFSLEIRGHAGVVHFYVTCFSKFRDLVEAHFYAQYPGVQLVEVPDYAMELPASVPNNKYDLWSADFKATKPDPYPIRTFREFEETVTGKMIDPLANLVEVFSRASSEEHLWLQIIAKPRKEDWVIEGNQFVKDLVAEWGEESNGGGHKSGSSIFGKLFRDIFEMFGNFFPALWGRETSWSGGGHDEHASVDPIPLDLRLSPSQRKILEAIHQNISRPMYGIKMRYMYIGPKGRLNSSTVASSVGSIKGFNDMQLNGVAPDGNTKTSDPEFIFAEHRRDFRKRKQYNRYRHRAFAKGPTFYFSSEELATIFHIPDQAISNPSLGRVTAKLGSAPANLPVEDLENSL